MSMSAIGAAWDRGRWGSRLRAWLAAASYRPERRYMRGGR